MNGPIGPVADAEGADLLDELLHRALAGEPHLEAHVINAALYRMPETAWLRVWIRVLSDLSSRGITLVRGPVGYAAALREAALEAEHPDGRCVGDTATSELHD